jgi:hypothetical protein
MRVPHSLGAKFGLLLLEFHLESNGSQEGFEVLEEVLFRHSGVEVEQVKKLPLHQVHLSQSKPEAFESLHRGISCPVLVLRT